MEQWCIIKYDHQYSISNYGRVLNNKSGRILGDRPDTKGYYRCVLNKKEYKQHKLVAEHFSENPNPDKFDKVRHKDGNITNNMWTNLEWSDQTTILKNNYTVGLMDSSGMNNGNLKISDDEVLDIWQSGMTVKQIQQKYGVAGAQAYRIHRKKVRKYLIK